MTLTATQTDGSWPKVIQFEGCKGIRIQALHYPCPARKLTLVIAPGRAEAAIKYHELATQLIDLNYEVAVIDHRGQGQSQRLLGDPQLGHMDDFEYCVEDMVALCRLLPSTEPLILIGHSMGGAISIRLLERYPQLAAGAVLCSPMLSLPYPRRLVQYYATYRYWLDGRRWQRKQLLPGFIHPGEGRYHVKPFDRNILTSDPLRYQQSCDIYQRHPALQLGGPTAGWVVNAYRLMDAIQHDVDQVKVPVLVINASRDRVVSSKGQYQLCKALGQYSVSGTTPLVIYDGQHELWQERDELRQQLWQALIRFLTEHINIKE